ncbi:TetR/AcrR family transcriptional regulator [Solilutibacter silvestris]|uniref:Transcriptional regulator n=1 Tax=Solilutibacter silvestris TaxID=1645665 RepID=A0A2K1Q203_9GAMM|nr:TetR/AcrR family transcriptional regulator [Lysobacter silvestris]PNS08977.1 Transcriptional regulator [Lysobacter silvestris]
MTAASTATVPARQRLLGAALHEFRTRGYAATTVDDLCRAAGVSKGAFFHHFASKEALALAAVEHWNAFTGELFAQAAYHVLPDPRDRVLAYVDLRGELLRGELAEYTCLLGTLVQETYDSHPALRDACRAGIEGHADTLVRDIAAAKKKYAPKATWTPESVALFTQAALQGGFILAKAQDDLAVAADAVAHLHRYIELLLPVPTTSRRTAK